MAPGPETPQENPEAIPDQTRAKLEAARVLMEQEATTETSGATKLAATNLAEAIGTNNRAEISNRLRQLRNDTNYARLSSALRGQLDQLQADVETVTEKGVRLTQETAAAGVNAVSQASPWIKYPLIGAAILGGLKLASRVDKGIIRSKDAVLDAGEYVANKASKAVSWLWTWTKRIGIAVGVGIASTAAWEMFVKPRIVGEEKPKTV